MQKHKCEHCNKMKVDVFYDEDFEGALCDTCDDTKYIWLVGFGTTKSLTTAQSVIDYKHQQETTKKGYTMFHKLIAKRNIEIGQLYASGMPNSLIAAAYGLSKRQSRKIIRRYMKSL